MNIAGCSCDWATSRKSSNGCSPGRGCRWKSASSRPGGRPAAFTWFLDETGLVDRPRSGRRHRRRRRQRAMLRVMADAEDSELDRVLPFLLDKKLLTPMLLLKAAAVGAMGIVDRVLAQLAGMPLRRVQALIYGRGSVSLRAVFNRSGLPESCLQLLQAAVEVERQARAGSADVVVGRLRSAHGRNDHDRFVRLDTRATGRGYSTSLSAWHREGARGRRKAQVRNEPGRLRPRQLAEDRIELVS